MNVAKVDVTGSSDLGTRFGIKGFPTLKFFKDGKIYDYKGKRDLGSLRSFARGDFSKGAAGGEPVPVEQSTVDRYKQEFMAVWKQAKKDLANKDYSSPSILVFALPSFLIVLFLLVIAFTPSAAAKPRAQKAAAKTMAEGDKKKD